MWILHFDADGIRQILGTLKEFVSQWMSGVLWSVSMGGVCAGACKMSATGGKTLVPLNRCSDEYFPMDVGVG